MHYNDDEESAINLLRAKWNVEDKVPSSSSESFESLMHGKREKRSDEKFRQF